MRMPVMPASAKNSAHSDHRYAATTPTEMRVSMVAAPWRRLVQAARWNGRAPQTTTGEARVRESHCQLSNCRAGIIDISSTGTVSTAQTTRRWRQDGGLGVRSPAALGPRRRVRGWAAAGSAAV